ncbi:hypothetical protein AO268_21725 [Pseudomonas sp. ICMP 8385]|nr:hypothetical protein BLL38_09360 [Pseudomonas gessardii]PHN66332.1 hypothetical protein AO268_21725 [Pseudomonas sp. ICMP 8385]
MQQFRIQRSMRRYIIGLLLLGWCSLRKKVLIGRWIWTTRVTIFRLVTLMQNRAITLPIRGV